MSSRLTDFMRMNSPICLASKGGEDSQEFLYGFYKVLIVIRVTLGRRGVSFVPIERG